MFAAKFVSFSLDAYVLSPTSLRVEWFSLALGKNIAGKVEIFAVLLKVQSELWIFEGAAVVMPQKLIKIIILGTVILLAETHHLFL